MRSQEEVLILQKFLKDYNSTANTIQQIRNLTSGLSIEEAENINNWLDVEEIEIDVLTAADSAQAMAIIANDSIFLKQIAEDNSQKGQVSAQLLLEQAGIAEYIEYTPLPDANQILPRSSSTYKENNNLVEKSQDLLYIYPNPVKDVLTIEYALLVNTGVKNLGIYDINGKLLKTIPLKEQLGVKQIDVSNLVNGNYIISFGTNGTNKYSKKFVVKH